MSFTQEKTLAERVRTDFPILQEQVNGKPLVYLDNASTSQKPWVVLNAVRDYYEHYNSNVHRALNTLSIKATNAYEAARDKVAAFVNAPSRQEIVFTRNATEAINLVAYSWGMNNLQPKDEIIVSVMEHHSNLIPWQLLAQKTGATIACVNLTPNKDFDLEHFQSLISDRTKLVAVAHVSNVLGCINPVEQIVAIAHQYKAKVLLDACQSAPHLPIDVQQINCDWLVASGHKMCAPTGTGFLYTKLELLESMPPFLGGGAMIADVFIDHATYAEVPYKFEAGTPVIGEIIGLGAAVDYLRELGMNNIYTYEAGLTQYLCEQLQQIPAIRIYGLQPKLTGMGTAIAAFTPGNFHLQDLSTILDRAGVAIRAGHHCTIPLHRYLGVQSTARVSLSFYNTHADIDVFIDTLTQFMQHPLASGKNLDRKD